MANVKIESNVLGTGTLTIAAPNTNTNQTLTLPNETGTIITSGTTTGLNASAITAGVLAVANGGTGSNTATFSGANITSINANNISAGTLAVARGGTGATTLTANAVIIGNTTGAVTFVSPGTSGNVLTSNGTAWASTAPSGGVTSLAAGNGITVSASTGAVTVSQNFYTGTTAGNTSFPVSSYLLGDDDRPTGGGPLNAAVTMYVNTSAQRYFPYNYVAGSTALSGTWSVRGQYVISCTRTLLVQRTA